VFGFLIKLAILASLAAVAWFVVIPKLTHSSVQNPISAVSNLKNQLSTLDYKSTGQKLSAVLDSLVTHQAKSPIVLGLEITNESLVAIVDALQNLPPDQMNQIRQYICHPASSSATPSAR
jgi:hypothetical protein